MRHLAHDFGCHLRINRGDEMHILERIKRARSREAQLQIAHAVVLATANKRTLALAQKLNIVCPSCGRACSFGGSLFRKFVSTGEEAWFSHLECSMIVCARCRKETEVHKFSLSDQKLISEYHSYMPRGNDIVDVSDDDL